MKDVIFANGFGRITDLKLVPMATCMFPHLRMMVLYYTNIKGRLKSNNEISNDDRHNPINYSPEEENE